MATCQTEVSADGFDIIRLGNDRVSVSVMPQLGGKIYQITDLETGRDWLWKNPHIALRHPMPGMDYDRELDSGGWDEILFSVKPCTLDLPDEGQMFIGDHGIAVDRAWNNAGTGVNNAGEAVCELFVEGQFPRFKLKRRITLDTDQARLKFEYSLFNTGPTPWPWLWCAHPLFAIESGIRINTREGQQIRLMQQNDATPVEDQAWPILALADGQNLNLEEVYAEPGTLCQKLFVRSAGQVDFSTADGMECLSMVYDPESLPWLGLWINNNAWSGCGSEPYLNLGLEPSTAPHEFLTEAVAQGQADFLQAGESRNWALSIQLKSGVDTHG